MLGPSVRVVDPTLMMLSVTVVADAWRCAATFGGGSKLVVSVLFLAALILVPRYVTRAWWRVVDSNERLRALMDDQVPEKWHEAIPGVLLAMVSFIALLLAADTALTWPVGLEPVWLASGLRLGLLCLIGLMMALANRQLVRIRKYRMKN